MRVWIFILLFLILAISPALASAQCTPPASGDWFVNETIVCSSEFITLSGDLLVNESGNISFEYSTLQFNSTSDGEYGIEVKGSLYVLGSKIESLSKAYTFVSKLGGNLEIRNSYVYDCGHDSADNKERGVYVKSDGTKISNTTFENNYMALIIYSDNNNISNNKMLSNYGGLSVDGSDNVITRNVIRDNVDGITTMVGDNIRLEHNVIEDNTGSSFLEMVLGGSVINNNSFVNNTGGGFGIAGNNNNVTDNVITSNGGTGLEAKNSQNMRIIGNTILENNYGLYMQYTQTTLVKDNLCNESVEYDIYMFSAEDTTFENTDYTSLLRKWFLNVTVVDMDSDPVGNADVVIKDNFTTTIFSEDTDSQGRITQQTLEEMIENESGVFSFSPYSINVTKSGYHDNFTTFDLTSDLSLEITLNETVGVVEENFTFTIESPENKTYMKKDLTENGTLRLTVTSEKSISSCNYYLDNVSGSLSEINSKKFQAYLNMSGLEGPYIISFSCISVEDVTNSSDVLFTVYPLRECMNDGECTSTQMCTGWKCVELTCECGYASNHDCVYYECCENKDCADTEICDTDTHKCELVPCECSEKRYDHKCNMVPGYCCSDFQCSENETCIDNECVERTLSFTVPEELVLGENVTILVLDQNSDPIPVVKIVVEYLDTDPFVTETYYTGDNGVVNIPIKHWGRVEFVARKGGYTTNSETGEVPEPFNWLFLIEVIVLIGAIAGIAIIGLKFLKGKDIGIGFGGPLKLEKTISGTKVMLKIKNKTDKKLQDITIRDSVPRGAFVRCNVSPKIEALDRATNILTWEILELDSKEEVIIEYDTRQANEGFSVKFGGKEYKG